MTVVEASRRHNINCNILVTHASTTQTRCSLATQAETLASLCSFWDIQLHIPVNSWNIHTVTKSCLDKVEIELVVNGRAISLKLVTRLNLDHNIKITIRAAIKACFTLTRQTDLLTSFHTSRDFHLNAVSLFFMPRSMTGFTRTFDFFSSAVTDITGHLATHHAKRCLGINIDDT